MKSVSHLRSLVKGFTWRLIATTTVALIVYYTTGEMKLALQIASIEFAIKIFLYYLHERLWLKIPFGQKENK